MLWRYSRVDEKNDHSENELNPDSESSRPQQSSSLVGEDFRSLLKTISTENSDVTIETTRMISEKIFNQMSMKLNEIKFSLSFQRQKAIITAKVEKVLPSIQNTLDTQRTTYFTVVDWGSCGLLQSPKATNFTTVDRRSSELQPRS